MSSSRITQVKCHHEGCRMLVVGYRITQKRERIFLCEEHFRLVEMIYLDSKEKMRRF